MNSAVGKSRCTIRLGAATLLAVLSTVCCADLSLAGIMLPTNVLETVAGDMASSTADADSRHPEVLRLAEELSDQHGSHNGAQGSSFTASGVPLTVASLPVAVIVQPVVSQHYYGCYRYSLPPPLASRLFRPPRAASS